jgi:DNA polymerase-3 subunit beta
MAQASSAEATTQATSKASPMQFVIERGHLLKSLSHVQSVVEKRGTIAVLSNIKIEAKGDSVLLTATDMDLAVVEKVPASVSTAGSTTVPAHTFYDIVRKLPDGAQIELTISDDGGKVAIRAGQSRFSLACLPVADFPRIEVAVPAGADAMPGVIVPRKAIHELQKLLGDGEGDVSVSLSETKIRFAYGNAVLVSKLIDGNFPDYERVIPSGNDKIMEVDCKRFKQSVDLVSVIASEKSRAIKFHAENGKLTLSASSAEHGTASEEIEVNYAAAGMEIGFNSRYLLDMMGQIEGDTAQFLLNDGASPAIVRDTADVGALYVIMPMRV